MPDVYADIAKQDANPFDQLFIEGMIVKLDRVAERILDQREQPRGSLSVLIQNPAGQIMIHRIVTSSVVGSQR